MVFGSDDRVLVSAAVAVTYYSALLVEGMDIHNMLLILFFSILMYFNHLVLCCFAPTWIDLLFYSSNKVPSFLCSRLPEGHGCAIEPALR